MSHLDSGWFNGEMIHGANLEEVLDASLMFEEFYRKKGIRYKSEMMMSEHSYTIIYQLWESPQDNSGN